MTLAIICMLCWTGIYFWHDILLISPFLIIIHSFLLYLFVVKFIYDNRSPFEILLTELREGGWILIKAIGHPGIIIWQKCTTGMDLLTQRLGVEQELVIAEKRRKTLEIELSQRRLHELLAKTTCILPDSTIQQMASEEKAKERNVTKLFLEVNENNAAALNLYKKAGFKAISRRANYYGKAAAMVMKKEI